MVRIKLSTLSEDDNVIVDGEYFIKTVSEILEEIEGYKDRDLYTVVKHPASFNAKDIIEDAIETEYNNGMYEDWDVHMGANVTEEDINDIQKILDRILLRNPIINIAYQPNKLIEVDI